MQKIRHRLLAGAPFWLFLCFLPVLVFFCWNLAAYGRELVGWIAPELSVSSTTRNYALELQVKGVHDIALRSFVATPLREEFLFRVLPFGLVWAFFALFRKEVPPLRLAFILVVATSVVFGYVHGGVGNIFIQGLIGVVLALVLLVWGSYGRTPLRGVLAVLLLHGAYNFYVAMWIQDRLTV
jgi:hypothetical protein